MKKRLNRPGSPRLVDRTIPGTDVVMQAYETPHDDAPKSRPYIFPPDQVRDVAIGVSHQMNIMLTGPTGCGKTSLPTAIAAVLGRPVIRFNCDGETRVSNIRGQNRPAAADGVLTLQFEPGGFAEAIEAGYWVILDELDAALPSVRFVLQPVLEEDNRTMFIPEIKKTILMGEHARIFATGNTIGYRAITRSQYAGTTMMNAAFLDRFGMVIAVDYPDKEQEKKRILANVDFNKLQSDEADDIAEGIARTAELVRTDEKFTSDFSTRRCVQWARLVNSYGIEGVPRAFRLAVTNKLESASDARIALETMQRIFGYDSNVPE